MRFSERDGVLTMWLEGRVTSDNAPDMEREINEIVERHAPEQVRLDVAALTFISSTGLRAIVRLSKSLGKLSVLNATPEVYDIFTMTGLSELVSVSRLPREQSLEGLKQIGAGAFGRVYRLDDERVIKVYASEVNPLEAIERERRGARQAFIHGIPSAIPFETVRAGDENGIIYELVNARTLGEAVMAEPARVGEYGKRMAELALQLHRTHFAAGELPDARNIFHGWVSVAEHSGLYAPTTIELLRRFVDDFGPGDSFVHGDFHPANIMVMPDGDLLLIDMGDASMGSPDIDLAGTYHVLRVASLRPGGAMRLTDMSSELLDQLWHAFVGTYFGCGCADADTSAKVESRLRILALPRTMGSTARSKLITHKERTQQARELEQAFLAAYATGAAPAQA